MMTNAFEGSHTYKKNLAKDFVLQGFLWILIVCRYTFHMQSTNHFF